MERIKTPTRVPNKHGPNRDGFGDGDPQLGLPSTQLEADWFDQLQEEVARVIELAGIALDPTDLEQLHEAINRMIAGFSIGEAPADGQVYGRNGQTPAWLPVLPITGGTLTGNLVAPLVQTTGNANIGATLFATTLSVTGSGTFGDVVNALGVNLSANCNVTGEAFARAWNVGSPITWSIATTGGNDAIISYIGDGPTISMVRAALGGMVTVPALGVSGNLGIGGSITNVVSMPNILEGIYMGLESSAFLHVDRSDARGKENIGPFDLGLEQLLQLEPKRWTSPGHPGNWAGFIAQEVEAIIPEAVVTRADPPDWDDAIPDRKYMTNTPIVAALVNGMQELAARVAALESARRS